MAKTFYSVPPEYVRRQVWVRWDLRLVRIVNARMEQIAVHARQQPGRFSTDPIHVHSQKRAASENGARNGCWTRFACSASIQPPATWVEATMKEWDIQGIRSLQGFLRGTLHVGARDEPAICKVEGASPGGGQGDAQRVE